jgi:hypothetical protein
MMRKVHPNAEAKVASINHKSGKGEVGKNKETATVRSVAVFYFFFHRFFLLFA